MKDSYNEYFIGELNDLTRDNQIRLIAGADDCERVTMKLLDTTKPNKNGRVFKGFEPGKIYYDTDNCFPSIRPFRTISPISVMNIVIATGSLILDELSSYKVSYSDYINEYRCDYTRRIESLYDQLLNRYAMDCSGVISSASSVLKDAIKTKVSSIYGWYGNSKVTNW